MGFSFPMMNWDEATPIKSRISKVVLIRVESPFEKLSPDRYRTKNISIRCRDSLLMSVARIAQCMPDDLGPYVNMLDSLQRRIQCILQRQSQIWSKGTSSF